MKGEVILGDCALMLDILAYWGKSTSRKSTYSKGEKPPYSSYLS